jgi:hypothetical protein
VEQAQQSYAKDSKNLAITKTSEPWKLKVDRFREFAQFVYDDVNPENPVGAPRKRPMATRANYRRMAASVAGRREVHFSNNLYAQIAPTLYNYTGNGDTFNGHFVGGNPALSNSASLATTNGVSTAFWFSICRWRSVGKSGTPGPHLRRLCR